MLKAVKIPDLPRSVLSPLLILATVVSLTGCLGYITHAKPNKRIGVYVSLNTGHESIIFDESIYCDHKVILDLTVGYLERWNQTPYAFEKTDASGARWRLYAPQECTAKGTHGYPLKLLRIHDDERVDIFLLNEMSKEIVSKQFHGWVPADKQTDSKLLTRDLIAEKDKKLFSISVRVLDVRTDDQVWSSELVQKKIAAGESLVFIASPFADNINRDVEQFGSRGVDLSILVRDKSLWTAAWEESRRYHTKDDCEIRYLRYEDGFWQATDDAQKLPIHAIYGESSDALVRHGNRVIPATRKIFVYDLKNRKRMVYKVESLLSFTVRWFNFYGERCRYHLGD